jgi:hypothetical protein
MTDLSYIFRIKNGAYTQILPTIIYLKEGKSMKPSEHPAIIAFNRG